MQAQFAAVPLPATAEELRTILLAKFGELTGLALDHPVDSVYFEQYAHGGMSAGLVHLPWWRDSGLPVLLGRGVLAQGMLRLPAS